MSLLFTAASSQYLSGGSAPVTADGVTIAGWFRPSSAAQSVVAAVGNATTGARLQLWCQTTVVSASRANNSLTIVTSDSGGGNPTGVWVHCAATFEVSGGNVTAWRNGTAGTPVTNPGGAITLNRFSIGARFNGTSFGLFADGDIAEVGVWSAILNADEINSLAKGFPCRLVRPSALAEYSRLIRNPMDLRGGIALTNNNGATASNHPRIIHPC